MYLHLRRRGTRRKAKAAAGEAGAGLIPGRTDIGLRTPVVDEKSRCGDLEEDLIIGKGHRGAVLTVVDRKSKHVWPTDGQDGCWSRSSTACIRSPRTTARSSRGTPRWPRHWAWTIASRGRTTRGSGDERAHERLGATVLIGQALGMVRCLNTF